MSMATLVGVNVAAILTIAITSLAWKDTPISKYAEHMASASAAGNMLVYGYVNIRDIGIAGLMQQKLFVIMGLILGVALYFRYFSKYEWISRYPVAVMVGIGTGLALRTIIETQFIGQIIPTFKPLWSITPWDSIKNLIVLVLVIITLTYFVFTFTKLKERPEMQIISTIDRYFLLIAFGAVFSASIMTRLGQYTGIIVFLLHDWLGLI